MQTKPTTNKPDGAVDIASETPIAVPAVDAEKRSAFQDDDADHEHVFSDPARAEHWQRLYQEADYEGRHRFDPSFRWSPQGERLLKRKVDIPEVP